MRNRQQAHSYYPSESWQSKIIVLRMNRGKGIVQTCSHVESNSKLLPCPENLL